MDTVLHRLRQVVKKVEKFCDVIEYKNGWLHVPAGLDEYGMKYVRRVTANENIRIPCKIPIVITLTVNKWTKELQLGVVDFLDSGLMSVVRGKWTTDMKKRFFLEMGASNDLYLSYVSEQKFYFSADASIYNTIVLPFRAPDL
jgi:hypothetical protein